MKMVLGVIVFALVAVCSALPPTLVWNNFINTNFPGNAYTAAPEAREYALYVMAAHDGLNSVHGNSRRKYTPYVEVLDNNIFNDKSDSVIVAAAYKKMLYYTITTRVTTNASALHFPLSGPGNQSYYINLVNTFYNSYIAGLSPQPTATQKSRGEALGEAAANSIWYARANDGFNRTIPTPYVPSFQPGKWYPRPNEAQIYPLKIYETPISVKTCYHDLVNPPFFDFDNSDYLADVMYTKEKGGKFNSTRTPEESISAIFAVVLPGPRYQTAMLTPLYQRMVDYAGYDVRDFTRLHALISMAQSDSYTCVFTQKAHYQFWRPWQTITRAAEFADRYPRLAALADPTWQPFQTTPNNPEYPAGHPTASSCLSHTLRRVLGWEQIPGGSITASFNASITETYQTIGEIEEKMVNARVFGGMHYRSSGRVGVAFGHKLVDFTVNNYLRPIAYAANAADENNQD